MWQQNVNHAKKISVQNALVSMQKKSQVQKIVHKFIVKCQVLMSEMKGKYELLFTTRLIHEVRFTKLNATNT